jgi:hypothetical protein
MTSVTFGQLAGAATPASVADLARLRERPDRRRRQKGEVKPLRLGRDAVMQRLGPVIVRRGEGRRTRPDALVVGRARRSARGDHPPSRPEQLVAVGSRGVHGPLEQLELGELLLAERQPTSQVVIEPVLACGRVGHVQQRA